MRILHTSDWHLGAAMGGHISRAAEHARFLSWLGALLRQERVDALVVAGDIFDQVYPSSEAQALLYNFLSALTRDSDGWPRAVIIVGGNHDSASRLDAPREVLKALDVTVIGGYEQASEPELLVPVHGPDGAVIGVVAAVPYVHEYRLGVTVRDEDRRGALIEAFAGVYRRLAELAETRWPGVPRVATGHLTCSQHQEVTARGEASPPVDDDQAIRAEDFPQPIHSVGGLGALPPTIFDPRWRYVALGHIHRAFPPEAPRVWYSGTPIPVSFTEASPRRVLLVDVDGEGPARVRPVEVPSWRNLVRVSGPIEAVEAELARWPAKDRELPTLFDLTVEVPHFDATLNDRLRERVHALWPTPEGRAIVAQVRQIPLGGRLAPEEGGAPVEDIRPSPAEIFARAWQQRHGQPPEPWVSAYFEDLLASPDPDEEA